MLNVIFIGLYLLFIGIISPDKLRADMLKHTQRDFSSHVLFSVLDSLLFVWIFVYVDEE